MREQSPLPFKTRGLTGFETSPNQGADLLEKYLGIHFPVKPQAVVLDARNKVAMLVRDGVPAFLASLIKEKLTGGSNGRYDYRYHTYFTAKGQELFTSLHENMHGFTASTNFAFAQGLIDLAAKMDARMKGFSGKEINVEEIIVRRSVDEGLAQYAAIEVADMLPDDFSKKAITRAKNLMLANKEDKTDEVVIDSEFLNSEYTKIQDAIALYTQAVTHRGPLIMRRGLQAEQASSDALYTAGYYFVYRTMKTLTDTGLSVADALTTIVKNPPATVEELRDTNLYITRLNQS